MKTRWTHLFLATSLATASVLATGGAALADEQKEPSPAQVVSAEDVADRIIDKLDQRVLDQAELKSFADSAKVAETTFGPAEPIPVDEQPAPGEVVLVRYADATVVHQSLAAGCTVSTTAGNPSKSNGKAIGQTKYYQSGCTDIVSHTSFLRMYWGFAWGARNSVTYTAQNNVTVTSNRAWTCQNSNTSPWRTAVGNKWVNSQTYIISESPTVNLACGSTI